MATITIAELDIDTSKLVASAADTKKAIQNLRDAQKILSKQGKQNTQEFVKNDVALKKLNKTYRDQTKVIGELNLETTKELNLTKQITVATTRQIKSIDQARKSNKELLSIRNKLNITTKAGQKELTKINAKLDKNNKFIKENVDQYSKQKIGIGDYEGALTRVFPQMNQVVSILKTTKTALIGQRNAQVASTTATNFASKSLKLFRIALISTGIGAIVVALGSLIAFLTTTQAGIDKVTKITKPLQVIFQSLLGLFQRVGETLFEAFSNPKQLLIDLVDFIKTNVINRFKAFAVILEGFKNFDFKQITDGILQATTGVENLTDKIVGLAGEAKEFFDEAIDKGLQLRQIAIDIELSEAKLVLTRANTRRQLRELQLIANDRSLAAEKNNEAAEKAIVLANDLATEEKALINLKIQEEEINQSLNDSGREDLKKLNELKAEGIAADEQARATELKFLTAKTAFNKQQVIDQKKAFELAIKNQKTLLSAFIAGQGIFKKSLEEELELSEQVSKKKIAILEKELQTKKITQEEFALASLEIENDLARQTAEFVISVAETELEMFRQANQSKLDANQFFTDELLEQEQIRLDNLASKEIAFQEKRLLQGVINEQEYLLAIGLIQDEHRIAKEEVELLRAEAENEQRIIDLDNQRAIDEEAFTDRFAVQSSRLELERIQEVQAAEKSGADVELINKKFAARQQKLDDFANRNKLRAISSLFGDISKLIGEQTALGKAAAVAEATINTYLAATAAYAAGLSVGGPAGLVIAPIAAGVAVATGLANVAKILGVSDSFYEGGQVPTGGGRISGSNIPTQRGGDNILATVKSGEVILNDQQQQRAGGNAFFKSIGVPGFAHGGTVPSNLGTPIVQGQLNQSSINDLASQINDIQTVLVVEDVSDLQGVQVEVIEEANI